MIFQRLGLVWGQLLSSGDGRNLPGHAVDLQSHDLSLRSHRHIAIRLVEDRARGGMTEYPLRRSTRRAPVAGQIRENT